MNALECWCAAAPKTLSGRYRKAAFAGLAAAAIVCGPVAGQGNPEDVGKWNVLPNTGPVWPVIAQHAVHLPNGSILGWQNPVFESFLWDPVLDALTEVPVC